jgi:hypothetical protein
VVWHATRGCSGANAMAPDLAISTVSFSKAWHTLWHTVKSKTVGSVTVKVYGFTMATIAYFLEETVSYDAK